MNPSKPKAAPKGVHDTVANLIHRNKYLGMYFKGSAAPDSRSLSSKRKQEIVDFLPSFIEHIRPVKQSRHFEPLIWKASTASKMSVPTASSTSAKISSPLSLPKDEEGSPQPALSNNEARKNDASAAEVKETSKTEDAADGQTPMDVDDDGTSATSNKNEAGNDKSNSKLDDLQAANNPVKVQEAATTTRDLDDADENYIPGSDAIVHKNTMERYQADLVKVNRELEELDQRRQRMLQKQVDVWGVYQYGLHKISKLSNLADAPDAILPGNFCSGIQKNPSAAATTTTPETSAANSAAAPPSKSEGAK